MAEAAGITVKPREQVPRPRMIQDWSYLSFLHWDYPPESVQRLLPPGLTADTLGGRAWVGLVGFHMSVRLAGMPAVPWLCRFPEINVRTYVRGRDGGEGLWFFSLDIARLLPVGAARSLYMVPYMWSRMSMRLSERTLRYRSQRRWPQPGARSEFEIEVGATYQAGEADPRDHFLTARWGLYTKLGDSLRYIPVEHPVWPLQRARLVTVEDGLVEAAGLPAPTGPPLVHYSPGVSARFGRLRPV